MLSNLSPSIFIYSSVIFVVGTSLNINEISPSWSLSPSRSQSPGNCVAVAICFTCGISKEDATGANLGLCFLPGILGWVETEPEKTMEREYSLHFSKEGHVGKISLHRRNELVGKNVVCKRGHGAT